MPRVVPSDLIIASASRVVTDVQPGKSALYLIKMMLKRNLLRDKPIEHRKVDNEIAGWWENNILNNDEKVQYIRLRGIGLEHNKIPFKDSASVGLSHDESVTLRDVVDVLLKFIVQDIKRAGERVYNPSSLDLTVRIEEKPADEIKYDNRVHVMVVPVTMSAETEKAREPEIIIKEKIVEVSVPVEVRIPVEQWKVRVAFAIGTLFGSVVMYLAGLV